MPYASDTALVDISYLNPFTLASMAECADPDTSVSPGAKMLMGVRDSVLEAIDYGSITLEDFDDNGQIHEIADGAPSDYTHARWAQFVDLAAWMEEPEMGEWPENLDQVAGIALYQIADRLAHRLCELWRDNWTCPICADSYGQGCTPDECLWASDESYNVDIVSDPLRVMIHMVEADQAGDRAEVAKLRHWGRVRRMRQVVWSTAAVVAVVAVLVVSAVMS